MRRLVPLAVGAAMVLCGAPVAHALEAPSGRVDVALRLAPASVLAGGQKARAVSAADRVVRALPAGTHVLWRTSTVYDGVAVSVDRSQLGALAALPDVAQVVPLTPKHRDSETAGLSLVRAASAWQATGETGAGVKVAVIDSGLDYLHTDFGGPGTGYADADPWSERDASVVPDGIDLVGDAYDPDTGVAPTPDGDPMDCSIARGGGHGTHVAGLLAGRGVRQDGTTFPGPWDASLDPSTLGVPPGVAPQAELLPVRVFGCTGGTDLVTPAIEWAVDHGADVIQLSLGQDSLPADDPDAVAVEAAAAAGVLTVTSAGNVGDVWSSVGSPGSAPSALTVAATDDGADPVDSLQTSTGSPVPATFGLKHTITTDESGVLADGPVTDTGCSPLAPATAPGLVAVLAWDDAAVDAGTQCGSADRGAAVAAAGFVGMLLVSTSDDLGGGINGLDTEPSALVGRTDGLQLLADRTSGPVTVTWTAAGRGQGVEQRPTAVDHVASFSSRGAVTGTAVKPEVSAPGVSMTSAGSGTGNGAFVLSGTSMAAPIAAGVAVLVAQEHPDWTPAMVKAAVVTTTDPVGSAADVTRSGTGRVRADSAVATTVLAGTGTVSFGDLSPTVTLTLTRTVTVRQTAGVPAELAVATSTDLPGVTLTASPAELDLDPGGSGDVTLTLSVDPGALVAARTDLSSLLSLTPREGTPGPVLHVAVGGLVRSGLATTPPAALSLTSDSAALPLSGTTGPGATVAAFTLQAARPALTACADGQTAGCLQQPSQADADLHWIGTSSTADVLAIATVARAPAGRTSLDPKDHGQVLVEADLDTDGDHQADRFVRLHRSAAGVLESDTFSVATGALLGSEDLTGIVDDRDTSMVLLLVPRSALPAGTTSVGVTVFGEALTGTHPVLTAAGPFTVALDAPPADRLLTHDQVGPGLTVSSPAGTPLTLLVLHPTAQVAQVVAVTHRQTVLIAMPDHLQLGQGIDLAPSAPGGAVTLSDDSPSTCSLAGAHVVALAPGACRLTATQAGDASWEAASVQVSSSILGPASVDLVVPSSLAYGQPVPVDVGVPFDGTVTLLSDGVPVGSGPLAGGQLHLSVDGLTVGTHQLNAVWSGDAAHPSSTSATVTLTVTPAVVRLRLSGPTSTSARKVTLTGQVVGSVGLARTLAVTVDGKKAGSLRTAANGKGKVTLTLKAGVHLVRIAVSGGGVSATSATLSVRSRHRD